MNKKGFLPLIPVFVTPMLLLVLALVVAVVVGGVGGLLWLLSKISMQVGGIIVLVMAGLSLKNGRSVPKYVWVVGGLLILLPFVWSGLSNLNLAMVVG